MNAPSNTAAAAALRNTNDWLRVPLGQGSAAVCPCCGALILAQFKYLKAHAETCAAIAIALGETNAVKY